MKHLILLIIILFLSFPAFANFGDSFRIVKEKVVTQVDPEKPVCAPHGDTPFSEVRRADLDLIVIADILDNPGDGRYDFYLLQNYHVQININLTNAFYAYGYIGQRQAEKTEVSDAVYDPKWTSITAMGGIGIYFTPVFAFQAGFGRIWLTNENDAEDKPPLAFATEYGVSYSIAWGSNQIILSWRIVEAPLDEEDMPTAAELQGNGSHTSFGVGLSIPFMR